MTRQIFIVAAFLSTSTCVWADEIEIGLKYEQFTVHDRSYPWPSDLAPVPAPNDLKFLAKIADQFVSRAASNVEWAIGEDYYFERRPRRPGTNWVERASLTDLGISVAEYQVLRDAVASAPEEIHVALPCPSATAWEGLSLQVHSAGDVDFITDIYTLVYYLEALRVYGAPDEELDRIQNAYLDRLIRFWKGDLSALHGDEAFKTIDDHPYAYYSLQSSMEVEAARLLSEGHLSILLSFDEGGGCGDPSSAARVSEVVSIPEGADVYFIGEYWFEVCKAVADPFDRSKCTQWFDAITPGRLLLEGRYVYSAEWPDGALSSGRFEIQGIFWEEIDNAVTQIKIRQ